MTIKKDFIISVMENFEFVEVFIVIKEVDKKDIAESVNVIKESFITVANEFGFTVENAPSFTAFAMTEDKLKKQLFEEHRPMYAFYDQGAILGYYSLLLQDNNKFQFFRETTSKL